MCRSCYTNHALDQFLEHLINVGIEKVIRIGGQSRSAILEGKNLRVIAKGESRTKHEGYQLASTYKALEDQEEMAKLLLKTLKNLKGKRDWTIIKNHLSGRHPLIYAQFPRVILEGFTTVGRDSFELWATEKALDRHSEKSSLGSLEQLLAKAMQNVESISLGDRKRLLDFWTEEIFDGITSDFFESVKEANQLQQQLTNVHDDVDRRVLQTADVIGVTTTGLARRIAALQHVQCKVVICEEAGEVLESHMISALLPGVEHFIQIGDHEQLRPQINNFKLSLESQQGSSYKLDRSQFERLCTGESGRSPFPVAQLNVQRRMRPEISNLIRETIYARLLDHDVTKSFPDVVGMRSNLYWLDHDNSEEGAQADVHQKSHSNVWEVEMVHALVRHIVRQGVYNSTDIAVLTPYTGQLQKLRTSMGNDFEVVLSDRDQDTLVKEGYDLEEGITETSRTGNLFASAIQPLQKKKMSELLRVATVDNFQGEEAKVVIVSLVRSNKGRKIGFLKTNNRINVLLSRAQHGMYLIGNTDTYSTQTMWAQVLCMLHGTNSVGKAFGLCCTRHKETEINVSQPDDFARFSPEGGCQLPCDRRLNDCGHRCQAKCHSDSMHIVFSCPQPCQRLHSPCRHSCQKKTCGEDCGLCVIKINDVLLPCGHSKDKVRCHQTRDLDKIDCAVIVSRKVPGCNHVIEVPCSRNVATPFFSCPFPCGVNLECGHSCTGSCGRCTRVDANEQARVKHVACSKICGRRFGTCNHNCPRACHPSQECGPCHLPCEVSRFTLCLI